MLPEQFDLLSFREILLVIRAEDDREKEAWRRTATLSTYVYNYGREHGKGWRNLEAYELFPGLYNRPTLSDPERADEAMEEANRREGEFIAMIEKKQARLAREAAEVEICSEKN
jgi:hypothetical protein